MEGLEEARIIRTVVDGETGKCYYEHTAAWATLIYSGQMYPLDPGYITAIANDDPAEMRLWLEGEAELLAKRPTPPPLSSRPKRPSDHGGRR
jgi:hypothetical protein